MSTPTSTPEGVGVVVAATVAPDAPAVRRVRHQARDALAVMAFSMATSLLTCLLLAAALVMLGPVGR